MTAVPDTTCSASSHDVPTMTDASGSPQPNLATLARLRVGGRNPLLRPTRRARRG
ncbi:hypothetical protein V3N99_03955 [Dermatophilaceae bacterium Soc4.6]